MTDDKVVPIKQDNSEDDQWTRQELEEIIEQGSKAYDALTQDIVQKITDLANISHKVGRYQQLLSTLPEDSNGAA